MLKKYLKSFFIDDTSLLFFPKKKTDCGVSLIMPLFIYNTPNCLVIDDSVKSFEETPSKSFTVNDNSIISFAHPNYLRTAFYSQNGDIKCHWFTSKTSITNFRNIFSFTCDGSEVFNSDFLWSETFINWATFGREIILTFDSDIDRIVFKKLIKDISYHMSMLTKDNDLSIVIKSCYKSTVDNYIKKINRNKKGYYWAYIVSIQYQADSLITNH